MQKGKFSNLNTSKQLTRRSFLLIYFSLFCFSFSLTLIFIGKTGFKIDQRTILSHFYPKDFGITISDFISDGLSEDTLHFVYAFVFGFTFFGKYASAFLAVMRGIAFGYSFYSVLSFFSYTENSFSGTESLLFVTFSFVTNMILIVFAAESSEFNERFRSGKKRISFVFKDHSSRRFIRNFLGLSGLSVFLKLIYLIIIYYV